MLEQDNNSPKRKIIHIDMDCFYAAIEIRDNPKLANKPIAVGGPENSRGVLCTCNYIARKFGVRSAMPTNMAKSLCKDLIILPVNMSKYKLVSKNIQAIFHKFTDLVEPLALDEAYLDVTNNPDYQNSATLIAQAIRKEIWDSQNLTASAGVAPNKFLAKIASGMNKPNGIYVITPDQVSPFVKTLPVEKIFGVGKVTLNKLKQMNLNTCYDLQQLSLRELVERFGKFGYSLYYQAHGIDNREINPNRIRKSLSVETTFNQDIKDSNLLLQELAKLHQQLIARLSNLDNSYKIKNQYIKLKYHNFRVKSTEIKSDNTDIQTFKALLLKLTNENHTPIRLLGLGVSFADPNTDTNISQWDLF